MLEVKISGGAAEIVLFLRQLGGSSAAVLAAADNPSAGTEVAAVVGPEVFGSGAPAPAETGAMPGPEVFGGAPVSAGAAQSSTAPEATPVSSTSATTAPAPTGGPLPLPPAPLPSAPLPASVAPTAAHQSAGPATTVDKNGLPWDARIHSESKATNADGTWRSKRNLDPAVKADVESQLRALMAHPVPNGTPSTAMPTPPIPGTATPAAVAATVDFNSLFQRSTAAIAAGIFTQDQLATMLTRVTGSPVMPLLINRSDLWPTVSANLTAMGA